MTTILFFFFLVLFGHSLSVGTKRIPLHYSLYCFSTLLGCNEQKHGPTEDGRSQAEWVHGIRPLLPPQLITSGR